MSTTSRDLRAVHFAEMWATVRGNRLAVYDELLLADLIEGITSTELADQLGWTVLSVRPRLTELRQMHLAEETGERRGGEHAFRALVRAEAEARWRAATASRRGVEPLAHTEYAPEPTEAAQAVQLGLF